LLLLILYFIFENCFSKLNITVDLFSVELSNGSRQKSTENF